MFSLFGGLLCVGGESHNTQKKANYSGAHSLLNVPSDPIIIQRLSAAKKKRQDERTGAYTP